MGSMNVATLAATDFLRYIGLTLVTILPIVNPVATAALLLGIGAHLGPEELQRQVRKACWYMAGILVVFLLLGTFIMQFFGLSLPGLRIAGGLIISFSGFKMLFPDEGTGNAAARAEAAVDTERQSRLRVDAEAALGTALDELTIARHELIRVSAMMTSDDL